MPLSELPTKPPQGAQRPYTKGMKQTKMTHDQLISFVMADYTAKVIADEQRRQAIRDGLLPAPAPAAVWNISDRD